MPFHAHLLRCNDGSYYAGHTDNLDLRMAQHASGELGGYTEKRLPVTLVWSDTFPTRDNAFAVERKLKGWSREERGADRRRLDPDRKGGARPVGAEARGGGQRVAFDKLRLSGCGFSAL